MTYLQKAKIDRYHLTPPKIVFNSNECKIKHRFGENPNPIYMGQLSTVDGRNLKYTRQDVPGINETNIDKDKINRRVYLMNDGEFYLNVDYSPYPSQRCVLAYTGHKNLKVSPNLQNKSTNFYNKTNNRYKNIEVYEFNLRNIGNGFSPTGAGKSIKSKSQLKRLQQRNQQLRNQLKRLQQRNQQLRNQLKRLQQRNQQLKNQLKRLQQRNQQLKNQLKRLLLRNQQLKNQLKKQ